MTRIQGHCPLFKVVPDESPQLASGSCRIRWALRQQGIKANETQSYSRTWARYGAKSALSLATPNILHPQESRQLISTYYRIRASGSIWSSRRLHNGAPSPGDASRLFELRRSPLPQTPPCSLPLCVLRWIYLCTVKATFFIHRSHCQNINLEDTIQSTSEIHLKMTATRYIIS